MSFESAVIVLLAPQFVFYVLLTAAVITASIILMIRRARSRRRRRRIEKEKVWVTTLVEAYIDSHKTVTAKVVPALNVWWQQNTARVLVAIRDMAGSMTHAQLLDASSIVRTQLLIVASEPHLYIQRSAVLAGLKTAVQTDYVKLLINDLEEDRATYTACQLDIQSLGLDIDGLTKLVNDEFKRSGRTKSDPDDQTPVVMDEVENDKTEVG